MMDIFQKPPSVLGALSGDPFGLQVIESVTKALRAAGIMAEIERTFAPIREAIRAAEPYRRAMASVPRFPKLMTTETGQ